MNASSFLPELQATTATNRIVSQKALESEEKLMRQIAELRAGYATGFEQYQQSPERFGEEVLGEWYTEDVISLMHSVRDHRSTVARSANATGKSHAAARIALWFLLSFPGAQVYTAAAPPESNLRNILWGELGYLLERHKHLFRGFKLNDLKVVQSQNKKWFLTGVTIPTSGTPAKREAAFSGKHAPYMLFICDEGDGIPPEVYRGIESCMSGGHVRLLVMFNPRHESGPVYLMERDRVANVVELSAFRHPNVVTGEELIPGAVNRDTTLRRINEWTKPLGEGEKVDEECFEVPAFLVGTSTRNFAGEQYPPLRSGWRRVVEPQFSYMVLGKYPAAAEGQLISRAWVKMARDRWDQYMERYGTRQPPHLKQQPILGGDVSEGGKDFCVAALRYPNGFIPELIGWNGLDVDETADRFAQIYHEYQVARACIDGNGFGAGVAPAMTNRHQCEEVYGVKVQTRPTFEVEEGEFDRMRDQLWWYVRCWLRHSPTAMLPPDELLCEELTTPTYVVDRGKIKVLKKDGKGGLREKLRRSPDRAEALMMTFFSEVVEQEEPSGALARALTKHRGV